MTTFSPRFVVRTDRPVDALLLDILRRVDAVARDLGIEYFVGGALARDLILLQVSGKDTGRAPLAPGMDIVMNVSGFAEAHASALMVELADGFPVLVTSLPALAVLELIAWRDRRFETSKDATDFLLIARNYTDAGNLERLSEAAEGRRPALLRNRTAPPR